MANVRCAKCRQRFDDEDRSTLCPHDFIMPEADLAQKKAAIELMDKTIRFAHQAETGPDRRVRSVGWNGMVTIADMDGEFAPHLFVVVQS